MPDRRPGRGARRHPGRGGAGVRRQQPQRPAPGQRAEERPVREPDRLQQRHRLLGRLRDPGQLRGRPDHRHPRPAGAADRQPGRLPGVPERRVGVGEPHRHLDGLVAEHRRLRGQRPSDGAGPGLVGGHPRLRLVRPGRTAAGRDRRDRLRVAHPHAPAGGGPRPGLRAVLRAARGVPGLPAPARQDLRGGDPPGRPGVRRGGRRAGAVPRRRLPRCAADPLTRRRAAGRALLPPPPAGATTSPSTRRWTSRPARAWARA